MRMRHATAVASVVVLLYCIVPVAGAVVVDDIFEYSIYDTLLRCLTARWRCRDRRKSLVDDVDSADGVEVSLPQTNSARIAYLHHKLLLVCRGGRVRLLLEGSRQDLHAQVGLRPATTIPPPEQWLFIS